MSKKLKNIGDNPIYIGGENVTGTDGFQVNPGEIVDITDDIYVICPEGEQQVKVMEIEEE